jgi:hypothetical protein
MESLMSRRPLLWTLMILTLIGLPAASFAGRRRDRGRDDDVEAQAATSSVLRDHLVTVSSATLNKGEFEVDFWSRYAKGLKGTSDADYFAHAVEAEFGLMKRWQIGVGANFQQPKSGSFSYTGLEAETRFRFGEPGKWFMNPAVTVDYEIPKDVGSDNPGGVEGKLILDKEMTGLGVVLNGIYDQGFKSGSESEFGYGMGLFKSVTKSVSAGVEFTGNFSENEQAHYAIPGIYFGRGEGFRMNLGASIGLTDESEPFGVRGFLEFEFD